MILIGVALLLLIIVLLTNRGDITTAVLILVGFSSFVTGIFMLTFTSSETVHPGIASLLHFPGAIPLSRLISDLGISGNAHFVPGSKLYPASIMQFNPVAAYTPITPQSDYSFYAEPNGMGVLTPPSGSYLLESLEQKYAVVIPHQQEELFAAISGVCEDVLEIAEKASVARTGDGITVELHRFRLYQGCTALKQESPRCCSMAPCPVCSLIASMIARGLDTTTSIDTVAFDDGSQTVRIQVALHS
ncbi:MAG TPA: hypothetical protein ENN85_03435 [Methanoculleus sp.]|nr:hypothetical protein [Methanoculleus sp.]